ncbi:carbon-monoxide dehydrogenase large subunit [Stella humosa]|uniref:Carbon-monoxide dehydrogenase large subunit n=1 Tax=Stella humosa TaxID=94 RepID=A0A3N1KZS2_9PROT|nr:xanthine dehydrogenase family protein molybdopterin-binding subunit [Stella humosa]ROP83828.1 carbon-monoxide dehydrogenase large subunit [Stella humosa]BBK32911.1 carbon monoxide dehydrogenase [Stella humosa]
MGQNAFGQPVRRKEDQSLLTGRGRFIDDYSPEGLAHAWMVRSPHAHARIRSIDIAEAAAADGVVAVLTGADLLADGIGGIPCTYQPPWPAGTAPARPNLLPAWPALAHDTVRYVGDGVAMVVAETIEAARSAAELIQIEWDELPAVVDPEAARADDAPRVHADMPDNACFDWETGDGPATDRAFAAAARIVTLDVVNNRVVVASMETRGATGEWVDGRYRLATASQMPHQLKEQLAKHVLHVPEDDIHVVVRDVGGSFGIKNSLYPEQILVMWAARRLERPVKWIGDRADAFLTDAHARDNRTRGELAVDADGRFLALRVTTTANIGAYIANKGLLSPTVNAPALVGAYATPAIHLRVTGVFTNTVPTDVYRGAGRPEAVYLVERLVDVAAAELGIDRVALRRRNVIRPAQIPYKTPIWLTYDAGDFEANLDTALPAVDWDGFEARRAAAKAAGRLRGIGMSFYVERCAGASHEDATLEVAPDGRVTVLVGTMANGQGHVTAYAQIVAEMLGLPIEHIDVIQGDTDRVKHGQGTGGSRSLVMGGSAVHGATRTVIDKARAIASHLLETAEVDIEFQEGTFSIVGTDRRVSFRDVAAAAHDPARLPPGTTPGLDADNRFKVPGYTYPNGCHVAEVEIDPETGRPQVVGYTIVHDFGRVLNPLMLGGQVHGGVAQGLGQALFEHTVYDADSGQLLSGSFMDYCIPRADDVPNFAFHMREDPAPANPLGVKGAGEAGCAGAPPAIVNAVVDALKPLGIRHVDMPLTPERLWRTIHAR